MGKLDVFGLKFWKDLRYLRLVLAIMNCDGLAKEWEESAEVRSIARDHGTILTFPKTQKICEATRGNCCGNAFVLYPMLDRLSNTDGFRLPHLDPLQVEIGMLYRKLGLKTGDTAVYKTAVSLKKLVGFIKRRGARKEVTKEPGYSKTCLQ